MADNTTTTAPKAEHGSSAKIPQKENIYEAEYLGSGTFRILKPKRAHRKLRQSRLKKPQAGARK